MILRVPLIDQRLSLSARLGVPSTIDPSHAILSVAENDSDIPTSFHLELNIALLSKQWLKVLGDDDAISSGQCRSPDSVIPILEGQLAQLRERFAGHWSGVADISYYALQLQAYSFSISRQDGAFTSKITTAQIQAKALSAIMLSVSEAAKEDPAKIYWAATTKYSVVFAATLGVFLAATTSQMMVKLSLLNSCRDAVRVIRAWALFPRDQMSRVATHITNAIQRLESPGGPSSALGSGKPEVCSRMTANIPYRVIWSAKHRRAFSSETEPHNASLPAVRAHPAAPQQELLAYSQQTEFETFDDLDAANFTDIFLDWQQLLDIG